ncbi:hypothetical protein [Bordetella sp. BOR01]|uniref:hypothetical protein n=1 Tax=Bordetella sp. BOR01 TaxID=2854779 RepID=UPI001C4775F3|nr:hypothetical protein [Bordetella sp. BOR01]MBV7483874.1 hypothetical protein [Bordetella sp. BOR01]
MNTRFRKASLAALTALVLALPLVQGCASSQDPRVEAAVADEPFYDWFNKLVSQIEADPKYKRIPIDTKPESNEFLVLLHDTYRHKITKQEFVQRVNTQYPGHDYETSFIVSRLP